MEKQEFCMEKSQIFQGGNKDSRDGYETKVPIDLDQEEVSKLHESANTLKEVLSEFFAEN